jgi:steroid delta-isomerase-like uncharacterized protein
MSTRRDVLKVGTALAAGTGAIVGVGVAGSASADEGLSIIRQRREAQVRHHMEAENEHEFDDALGTFGHPRYEIIPTGAVYDGDAQVSAYYAATRQGFPDQTNELVSLYHSDDSVIVEFILRGTHRGEIWGIPPTNKSFECRMSAFFLFEPNSDKMTCERVYFDIATILEQLGLIDLPIQ